MIMVVYEVNLIIKNEIFDAYYQWLVDHIKIMLTFDGFKEARIQRLNDQEENDNQKITVCYTLESQAALDSYLTNHAPKMREEGIKNFGNQFSATRRIFEVLEHLPS